MADAVAVLGLLFRWQLQFSPLRDRRDLKASITIKNFILRQGLLVCNVFINPQSNHSLETNNGNYGVLGAPHLESRNCRTYY